MAIIDRRHFRSPAGARTLQTLERTNPRLRQSTKESFMSKTFALFAAVAALAFTSPVAFAATADSAPPGYVTWTSTPSSANQAQSVAHTEKSMVFGNDAYG